MFDSFAKSPVLLSNKRSSGHSSVRQLDLTSLAWLRCAATGILSASEKNYAILPWLRHTDDFPNKPTRVATFIAENRRCYPLRVPLQARPAVSLRGFIGPKQYLTPTAPGSSSTRHPPAAKHHRAPRSPNPVKLVPSYAAARKRTDRCVSSPQFTAVRDCWELGWEGVSANPPVRGQHRQFALADQSQRSLQSDPWAW